MRVAGKHATSLSDGKGVNYVLFLQGCDVHCKDCQNPSTWDRKGGVDKSVKEIERDISSYVPPVTGVTFSGGEPSLQIEDVSRIARWAKKRGLSTTLYSGHSLKDLYGKKKLKKNENNFFDYVITEPFIPQKRSRERAFRGSRNQKIYKQVFRENSYTYIPVEIDNKGNIIND